jgi:hypothetical protein
MRNERARPPAPPPDVANRLETLRTLYVAETDQEARARLSRERPRAAAPFPVQVAARLEELRALCDLAAHLHRAPSGR